jgi:hypothetical protein
MERAAISSNEQRCASDQRAEFGQVKRAAFEQRATQRAQTVARCIGDPLRRVGVGGS